MIKAMMLIFTAYAIFFRKTSAQSNKAANLNCIDLPPQGANVKQASYENIVEQIENVVQPGPKDIGEFFDSVSNTLQRLDNLNKMVLGQLDVVTSSNPNTYYINQRDLFDVANRERGAIVFASYHTKRGEIKFFKSEEFAPELPAKAVNKICTIGKIKLSPATHKEDRVKAQICNQINIDAECRQYLRNEL